ncbi:TPA: hypothetical protein H2V50_004430, partial [Salmonella enterica]|nr:hypothetical protein [Salmonella enterica]
MRYIVFILLLFLPFMAEAGFYDFSTTINQSFDLSSPPESIQVWDHTYTSDSPHLPGTSFGPVANFALSCLSSSNAQYGACSTYPTKGGPGEYVKLAFTEKRSHMVKELTVMGYYENYYNFKKNFANVITPLINATRQHIYTYIPDSELKKLPIGGIWKAHLELPVWAMHTYKPHSTGNYW